MVVVCESCSTRFRIDDARIPAKGRLVRCSQCKATFIAKPQDASVEETIEEVVAEVTGSGGAPLPEAAADLFDAGGEDLGDTVTRPGRASDDERWEFDEEPRKANTEPLARDRFGSAHTEAASSAPLDDIGDPTEWDLLRGSVEPEARKAEFIERPEPAPRPREREAEPEPFLRPIRAEAAQPAAPRPARARRRVPTESLGHWTGVALRSVAWLVLGLLAFTGVEPLFHTAATQRVAPVAQRTVGLTDGEARNVQGVFVENAFAPVLFVVRGELVRPQPDTRLGLRVHFVAADGARIGDGAWAGVTRTPRDLREHTRERLQGEIDASAAAAALGGPFVSVFADVPAEAAGFGLSLEPLPQPAPAPDPAPEAAPEPTASSPPSLHPSSE